MLAKDYSTWPDLPLLPLSKNYIVIKCINTDIVKSELHTKSREIIKRILAYWINTTNDKINLVETRYGPSWEGNINDEPFHFSISYSNQIIWIAIGRDVEIGIDACTINNFSELKDVSRLYFDEEIYSSIVKSSTPGYDFAKAWSKLEAVSKLKKSNLVEFKPDRKNQILKDSLKTNLFLDNEHIVTVAFEQRT
jgi:phosphopantetheinyl transferase